MKRSRPRKEYDLAAAKAWFDATCRRPARCVVCQTARGLQAHHVIDKSWLERVAKTLRLSGEDRNALLWDTRNGMSLCPRDHERHTNAYRRIPRYLIPAKAWEFAREVDRMLGTEAATLRLEQQYPLS